MLQAKEGGMEIEEIKMDTFMDDSESMESMEALSMKKHPPQGTEPSKRVKQSGAHEKAKPKDPLLLDLMQLLLKILLIAGCIFSAFTFIYGVERVTDLSMAPSFKDGDLAVYYRLDKLFYSGDVALFQYEGKMGLGRVVALEGDTVDITADGVYINGALQISQDVFYSTTQFENGVDFPLTVGKGQIFLLGDNRPSATDSRVYGCVDLADVKGKIIMVIRTRGV